MNHYRLPVAANNVEDTDTKSVAASPNFFPNMFTAGRSRKLSISSEPLGCLALLDAGEQSERPRALPSTGDVLPTCVKAQPTVHLHRPRAVLSSPENDELACELQGQQWVRLISSDSPPQAVRLASDDLPHAPLSSMEDLGSKDILRAVSLPPHDVLSMGANETSVCDEASSCSTSSHQEPIDEPNELLDRKQSKSVISVTTKGKKSNHGWSSESRLEGNGNEENLSVVVNQTIKKHGSLPSNATSRGPSKQLPKPVLKSKSPRVLRPWY